MQDVYIINRIIGKTFRTFWRNARVGDRGCKECLSSETNRLHLGQRGSLVEFGPPKIVRHADKRDPKTHPT